MHSSILTTPNPFSTWPKITCLPSKCDVGTVVMKNWEPLVLGPALAMLRRPTLSCCVKKVTHVTHNETKQQTQNRQKKKETSREPNMLTMTLSGSHCRPCNHWPIVTDFCCTCHLLNLTIVTILQRLKWNSPAWLDSEQLAPPSGLKSDYIFRKHLKFTSH